jgi:CheY-like chemotaxis protein
MRFPVAKRDSQWHVLSPECNSTLGPFVYAEVRSRTVLSVEDDDGSFSVISFAFREVAPSIQLQRVVDGDEALAVLRQNQRSCIDQPSLILMNLNLPKRNGFELLNEMQRERLIDSVPVVVFSSSSLDSDKARCLALGAKAYFTKPDSFDGVIQTIESVCSLIA